MYRPVILILVLTVVSYLIFVYGIAFLIVVLTVVFLILDLLIVSWSWSWLSCFLSLSFACFLDLFLSWSWLSDSLSLSGVARVKTSWGLGLTLLDFCCFIAMVLLDLMRGSRSKPRFNLAWFCLIFAILWLWCCLILAVLLLSYCLSCYRGLLLLYGLSCYRIVASCYRMVPRHRDTERIRFHPNQREN